MHSQTIYDLGLEAVNSFSVIRYNHSMELSQACKVINPTSCVYSFFPLFAMTKQAKNMVRVYT